MAKKTQAACRLIELARQHNLKIVHPSLKEMARFGVYDKHRGCALEVRDKPAGRTIELKEFLARLEQKQALILIMDRITDPHNLGAILRSADLFACDLVILPRHHSVKETAAVIKTSAGASRYVPQCVVANLNQAVALLKQHDFWVYGAAPQGQQAAESDLKGRVALVMGSEGSGLADLLRKNCDGMISIATHGHIDSLNVSVATGILVYEIRRQQGLA